MALEKFLKDMGVISALDDEPNDAGGLTASELKAKFDEGGVALQEFLNKVLLPALENLGVEEIVRNGNEDTTVKLYLRVNESNHLEASVDGKTYEEVSGGHIIEDRDYQRLPDKKFLRFINGILIDAGASIEIRILPDWNDVEGKPFHGEEVTLFEWSEDYVPIKQVGVNEWRGFYKISNTPMTEQELLECTVSYTTSDGKSGSVRVTEEMIDYFKDTDGTLRAIGADMGDYVGIFVGLEFVSVITEVGFGEQLGIPNLDAGVWVGFDYPGQNDTITKITREMNMKIDKAVLPPIEADDLPNIPKEKLPAIETGDLPPISWNALTDRPFGDIVSEAKFTTSEDMPIAFTAYTAFSNYEYTKVSDLVPSREQLMSAVFTATVDYTDSATIDPNGSVLGYNEQYTQILIGIRSYPTDLPFIVAYQAGEITMEDGKTFTAPSAGIYLGKQTSETFPNGAVVSIRWEELKKIDEKYLPTIAELPPVTTADNGKFLGVVNGAWGAVQITDGNEVAW